MYVVYIRALDSLWLVGFNNIGSFVLCFENDGSLVTLDDQNNSNKINYNRRLKTINQKHNLLDEIN